MMKLLFLTWSMLCTFFLWADEIVWTDMTGSYDLASGITLMKGTRSSPALECFYLDADLNDTAIALRPYSAALAKTVKSFAADVNCIAAVNGGYFGGNIPYSTVIYPGEVKAVNVQTVTRNSQSYPLIRSMFSLNSEFTPQIDWVYHFGQSLEDVYRFAAPLNYTYNDPAPRPVPLRSEGTPMEGLLTAVGGGPVLVKDSSIYISYNEEVMWGSGVGLDNRDPRTAVGYTSDGHVILLVADGRQTHSEGLSLPDMAALFLQLGCVAALNLDGGGSTQMAVPGTDINRPSEQRAVPAILALTYRDSCKLPPESDHSVIIDTEDSWATRSGSWFASANAGYWGGSKAMLSGRGDGSSIYRFYTALNETARCDVYAWWVADPNRSSETPFVIIHQDGRDTVRMNQQQGHAQWNKLGTFSFSQNEEHAVIVSNLASTGNYVVADAVKLSSATPISLMEPTSVHQAGPRSCDLLSVYPNPFNPQTSIRYSLDTNRNIKLEVFDIQGNRIITLAEGRQEAGNYLVVFNGSEIPAGIYFCAMTQDEFQYIEKITLLK
ncbi:MAG: phosphodiester glycosidase family protein [Candidatus Marinimicrobia bacterium]|nr:phosphodiester glycosidase family protein [Candidatus Neomarinimicrobiota bacterium]